MTKYSIAVCCYDKMLVNVAVCVWCVCGVCVVCVCVCGALVRSNINFTLLICVYFGIIIIINTN